MKITPNALSLNQLFGSVNEQFVIPPYQRRYSWRYAQIAQFYDDINGLRGGDAHLLGTIVCLTTAHSAGINELELVDGQQRLTTIAIFLECLRERFKEMKQDEQVQELNRLLTSKPLGGKALPKISLDTLDGEQFRFLVENPEPQDHEYKNARLEDAFVWAREWLADLSTEEITAFSYHLLNNATVVRLDVSEAKDAFKLFETINNRGLRLSPTDIIKNFMLGNAARFGNGQLNDAKKAWSRLIEFLDAADSDSFFRYFLIAVLKRRLTKGEVTSSFEKLFMTEVKEAKALPERHFYVDEDEIEDDEAEVGDDSAVQEIEQRQVQLSFKEFLYRLVECAKIFGQLVSNYTGVPAIDRHLGHLRMIKAAQTYGFLMHLRVGGIDDATFIKILKLTENFILRRHVCRERANETETLFAKLCHIDPKDALKKTITAYREACPSDDKFREEFASAAFTSNIIDRARYCLSQIELAQHGKYSELLVSGSDEVHVEHIIPRR